MKQKAQNLLWLALSTTTLLFWFLIYKAGNAEYDLNIAYFFSAVLISILTLLLIIHPGRKGKLNTNTEKVFRIIFLLFGSPLTIIFLAVYMEYIHVGFV